MTCPYQWLAFWHGAMAIILPSLIALALLLRR
jgi:hypothetical protein